MNFWKTSFWATVATIARLSSQFVVAKIIAIYAGAATFGLLGQFQSFITMIQLGSGGIVSSGVTKYSSQYHNQPILLKQLIYTSIRFVFYASVLLGIVIVVFSKYLSFYLFQSFDYWWVLVVFGITLFGYTLNQLFLSIFNGLNQMVKYAGLAIFSAIFSILLIGGLTFFYHTKGALLGLVLSQFCLFIIGCFYIQKIPLQLELLKSRVDMAVLKKLLAFSIMTIISVISLPLAQIFLRSYVAHHLNWTSVGYWQAILKISDAYLLVITMIISTYALPKYSRIGCKAVLRREVFSLLVKLVPLTILIAIGIYIFRYLIITLLFSHQFLAMENLFKFQLIGDMLKVSSSVLANVLLAKTQIKMFIFLELIFTLTFITFSLIFFNTYNTVGLTMAFAVNYAFYFVIVLIWFLRWSYR